MISHMNIFNQGEEAYFSKFRARKDLLFRPVCLWLDALNVDPTHLSIVGLMMVIPFGFFLNVFDWLALLCLGLNIFLDAIDGSLARHANKSSAHLEWIDIFCDYASFFVIYLTLFFKGYLGGFWAYFYIINYAVMLWFVHYANSNKIRTFPVFRSKYFLYLTLVVFVVSGVNLFDPFLVLVGVYMFVSNVFLVQEII